MAEYIIRREARDDINKIWVYTAENWSFEQADRYYNLILDEIEYVAKNFDSARDFGHFRVGYKYSKVKSHLVFFRKTFNGEIEVVRVLHERMDLENRLLGD